MPHTIPLNIYFTLFEEMADPVMLIKNNRFISCNQASLIALGYSDKATFVNLSPWDVAPEFQADGLSSKEKAKSMIALALQQGHLRFDWLCQCYNGDIIDVEVTLTAITVNNESLLHLALRDNTPKNTLVSQLKKASDLQYAIFNSRNFSKIATDVHGVIQIFNVGAETMLGYSAAEVVNIMTAVDLSDPQELSAQAAALSLKYDVTIEVGFQTLICKASLGIEDIYELTYICKDGRRLAAEVSVTALRDEQNKIIGYLLIGTDNTVRKLEEELLVLKLKEASALQDAIFNSHNFSSIATDVNGVIQIFNVGAETMLGFDASEVVNIMTPADLSEMAELNARAVTLSNEFGQTIGTGFDALVYKAARGIEDIYELTYLCKDGSHLPALVSVTSLKDEHDFIIGYLLIGTDNTARKRVEKDMLVASVAFESAQSMYITDPQGYIINVNHAFTDTTGYELSEILGNTAGILSSGKSDKAHYKAMWASLLETGAWTGEVSNKKKNG